MNNIFNLSSNVKFKLQPSNKYVENRYLSVLYTDILGARQFGNFVFTFLLLVGGFGFLFAGLITYITQPIYTNEISFIPQGILLTFYGMFALTLCGFIFLTLSWDIGSGYNEINKDEKLIRIQRKSFPGKSQSILLTY